MKSKSEGVPNRFEKKKMIRKKRIIGEEGTDNCKNHISHYLPKIEASNNRIGKRMLQSPNSVSSKKTRVGETTKGQKRAGKGSSFEIAFGASKKVYNGF